MYRIVKRIVHTITTVTLFVRWDDSSQEATVETQITLPASHSFKEEVLNELNDPQNAHQRSNPTLDEGENP